LSLFSRG